MQPWFLIPCQVGMMDPEAKLYKPPRIERIERIELGVSSWDLGDCEPVAIECDTKHILLAIAFTFTKSRKKKKRKLQSLPA